MEAGRCPAAFLARASACDEAGRVVSSSKRGVLGLSAILWLAPSFLNSYLYLQTDSGFFSSSAAHAEFRSLFLLLRVQRPQHGVIPQPRLRG